MAHVSSIKPKAIYTEPKKGEHGIGAIVEKTFSDTTKRNSDGSKIQTVIFKSTINIRNNKFGEQFVINYGTREEMGKAIASWTLAGVLLVGPA